ncbi:MAG TPA: hypothetical protein PLV77_06445, partial [Solirubrobacterales bacterium]|nr:hypothetical protein [Solirubrobacterales bacterium]
MFSGKPTHRLDLNLNIALELGFSFGASGLAQTFPDMAQTHAPAREVWAVLAALNATGSASCFMGRGRDGGWLPGFSP